MSEMRFEADITPGDMEAAYTFIRKRAKRHPEIMNGVGAALYSVMFAVAQGLRETGFAQSDVDRLFDQFKAQIAFQLAAEALTGGAT